MVMIQRSVLEGRSFYRRRASFFSDAFNIKAIVGKCKAVLTDV